MAVTIPDDLSLLHAVFVYVYALGLPSLPEDILG